MVKIDVEYILPQNADGLNHTCTKLQMQGRMKTSLTQSYYKKRRRYKYLHNWY